MVDYYPATREAFGFSRADKILVKGVDHARTEYLRINAGIEDGKADPGHDQVVGPLGWVGQPNVTARRTWEARKRTGI